MENTELIGPYRVRALIARGGMGEVWRARHPTLERDVAVKLVRADLHDKPHMRELFHREVQVLSRLRSPQSVQVMDAGITDSGQPYIVTEFLQGEDLQSHLKSRGPLPVPEAVEIAVEVLKSLAEAHAIDLVHRDIKPANIFLQTVPGGGRAVKVLDFGVAKLLTEVEGDETLAGGSALKGSPRYMAPEQIHGRGLSPQTDLYAVGGLLYQMISGEPVFTASGREALLQAHLSQMPVSLQDRCPLFMVPPALDALVLQCLRKNATERPWGARELIVQLQRTAGAADVGLPELGPLPTALESEGAGDRPFTFEDLVGDTAAPPAAQAQMAGMRRPSAPQPAFPRASQPGFAPVGGGGGIQASTTTLDPPRFNSAPAVAPVATPQPARDLTPLPEIAMPGGAPAREGGASHSLFSPEPAPAAPAEDAPLELADVPGRRRTAVSNPSGGQRPAPRPGDPDPTGDLQLQMEPRAVAEGQRRMPQSPSAGGRRVQANGDGQKTGEKVMLALVAVGLLIGGFYAWTRIQAAEKATPAAATKGLVGPAPATETGFDPPPVARRQFAPVVPRAREVTVGVSTGTANFIRVDTNETVCTDAVECPMPVGVGVRVARAGNKRSTTLPPLSVDQAKAGVIKVELK